ncbi:MAG: SDR family oxidoreductase [Planctomycetota bacterium]|nr:SDR family oxidoreductase [Planctomycetota bacterium]
MRILVLGASGMLGHKVLQALAAHEVQGTVRTDAQAARAAAVDPVDTPLLRLNAREPGAVEAVLDRARPEVVVNAIGLVKQRARAGDAVAAIEVNALLPHRIAAWCQDAGARLIHFSTDCVFEGARGHYTEADTPDARDLYGRSKLLGEVAGPSCLTLRTSIIGRELATTQGLLEWFLSQAGGAVQGYSHAIFSGLPTVVLAEVVRRLIDDHPTLEGVYHVAADPIAKLDLLVELNRAFQTGTTIVPDDSVRIDRSLDGTRFHDATGISFGSWEGLVDQMAKDPTPYEEIRRVRT